MSGFERKINVRNKSPNGRRLWMGKGRHVDVPGNVAVTVEIGKDVVVTSIVEYQGLLKDKGVEQMELLIYNHDIFDIEEHSENTEKPKKIVKKRVKRLER